MALQMQPSVILGCGQQPGTPGAVASTWCWVETSGRPKRGGENTDTRSWLKDRETRARPYVAAEAVLQFTLEGYHVVLSVGFARQREIPSLLTPEEFQDLDWFSTVHA